MKRKERKRTIEKKEKKRGIPDRRSKGSENGRDQRKTE